MKRVSFMAIPTEPLLAQLLRALEPVVGPLNDDAVKALLAQGSVFRDKVRWKETGPPGLGSIEVFWPDLPVAEFTLNVQSVVWEDDHLVVVDKPAGVNTAPSPFSDIDCLTHGVARYLGHRVDAVHRLDRDTRGLVIFAKHKQAEHAFHALFRERAIRKVYRAVTPPTDEVWLLAHRWRDELDWRGKVQAAATTALRCGTDTHGRGVWTVLPHTGRPHQIRKHFARYLVPLWGDRVYAPGLYEPSELLGLTCVQYRFRHPITGSRLDIVRPPTLDQPPTDQA